MLEKIAAENARLNAFITLSDAAVICGDSSLPLANVTVAVKDNICTRDMKTTCASKFLADFSPCYDAHAVELLRRAGAVIVGKTNMDEFGMGSTGENSAFGAVKNPHDPMYSPGGSSSGSAAAVAAGLADIALGSDTGGSVRQPASHCGVVGLKPSYGAVSRFGLVSFASSLEQIGIIARTVADAERAARVIYSRDERDQTSAEISLSGMEIPPCCLRIGVCEEYNSAAEGEVRDAVCRAVNALEGCGAQVVQVTPPMTRHLLAMYYIISSAEASSNLARYDGIKYGLSGEGSSVEEIIRASRTAGFGDEVKRRILMGTFVLSEGHYGDYYGRAAKAREKLRREYGRMLSRECDVFISPVASSCAPRLGELSCTPSRMHESDLYTVAANLTGFPAISVPTSVGACGLPIGVQLTAGYGQDAKLIAVAEMLERALKGGDAL